MNYINIDGKLKNKGKEVKFSPFRLRGNYIANIKDNHEKIEHFWTVNCLSGSALDDLDLINHEIELVQARNTRVKSRKSMHIVLSLNGESLDEKAWRDADAMLAKKLGLEDHQRVVALHKDTENSHLHVVYNLIHPETFKKESPFQDFKHGADVCRAIEEKYELHRDVGYKEAQHNDTRSQGAKDMEAHTFHQSFESYVLEHKEAILAGIAKAKDWHDVHEVFAQHDLRLNAIGAGLAIVQHKKRMKASTLDRSCSKNALEKRFGQFKARSRDHKKIVSTREKYGLKPRFPLKGNALNKWKRFLGIKKKDQPLLTWKDYLMLEAGFDPLAMVLIKANKTMIDGLLGQNRKPTFGFVPIGKSPSDKQPTGAKPSHEAGYSMQKAIDMGAFEETALDLKDVVASSTTKKKDTGFEL